MSFREAPLHEAAFQGHTDVIKELLKGAIHINSIAKASDGSYFFTALHWAIYKNNPESVKLLLEHGADPSIQGKSGKHKTFFNSLNNVNIILFR